jgi:hypothetical protein
MKRAAVTEISAVFLGSARNILGQQEINPTARSPASEYASRLDVKHLTGFCETWHFVTSLHNYLCHQTTKFPFAFSNETFFNEFYLPLCVLHSVASP